MKMKIVLLSFMFALLNITSAHAEKCWMAGCKNEVHYLLIPQEQYLHENDFKKPGTGLGLFKEFGLPNVNSVITINHQGYTTMKQMIACGQSDATCTKEENELKVRKFEDSNIIRGGTKIKILGYYNEYQSLYAIIQIVEEK